MTGRSHQRSRLLPRGFTLMEILVVVAVFGVTSLVATNIFLLASKASRRTAISQKLQGDVRFALEAVTREVRFGTIDYDCYNAMPSCDPETPETPIDLADTAGKTSLLALRDVSGNRVRYKFVGTEGAQTLQVCFIDVANEALTKCNNLSRWESVTPEGVQIVSGGFFLYPFDNPFKLKEPVPPTGSPYLTDAQPRVTVVLKTEQVSTDVAPERIATQTTVTSRYYAR